VRDKAHLLHYWQSVGVPRGRVDVFSANVTGALDVSAVAAAVASRTTGQLRDRALRLKGFGEIVTLDVPAMTLVGQLVSSGPHEVELVPAKSEWASEAARRATQTTHFYHGSFDKLSVGTVLRGRTGFERDLVEKAFEHMRPSSMVSRMEAVFMVQKIAGMEEAGGGAAGEYVYEVEPIGRVSGPFHGGWHGEMAKVYLDDYAQFYPRDLTKYAPFIRMADAYWRGQPCVGGRLCAGTWEWITPEARIVRVVRHPR
jgi:hypothetical protein